MRYFSPMATVEQLESHLGALPSAVLGYSGTVAIGHILLTTWGTVIVGLIA